MLTQRGVWLSMQSSNSKLGMHRENQQTPRFRHGKNGPVPPRGKGGWSPRPEDPDQPRRCFKALDRVGIDSARLDSALRSSPVLYGSIQQCWCTPCPRRHKGATEQPLNWQLPRRHAEQGEHGSRRMKCRSDTGMETSPNNIPTHDWE
jgi:hypothetical protein